MPGRIGSNGRRIQRLDLAPLVQAEHHGMVGRIQIQADDVAHLVHKMRSADNLTVLRRCDCRPKVCQIREIVAFERLTTSAMLSVVHWVAIGCGPSSVSAITSTTRSS
jgi:hypothetical protein